jgi:hypothetical protein
VVAILDSETLCFASRNPFAVGRSFALVRQLLFDLALDFEQVLSPNLRQLDRLGSIAGARP